MIIENELQTNPDALGVELAGTIGIVSYGDYYAATINIEGAGDLRGRCLVELQIKGSSTLSPPMVTSYAVNSSSIGIILLAYKTVFDDPDWVIVPDGTIVDVLNVHLSYKIFIAKDRRNTLFPVRNSTFATVTEDLKGII